MERMGPKVGSAPPPPLIEELPLSKRVALFARSTSFPIENMRSTEALEGTSVFNFANTYTVKKD